MSVTTTSRLLEHAEGLFLDGGWSGPVDGRLSEVYSPSTEESLSRVALGGPADIDAAVASARRAFDSSGWSDLPAAVRAEYLTALGRAFAARYEQVAALASADVGTPIGPRGSRHAAGHIAQSILDNIAVLSGSYPWIQYRSGPTVDLEIRRVPVGVVGAIVPWNLPLNLSLLKIAPALLAGCTVVLKPPEEAPLGCLLIGEVAAEVGLPAGVLNIVTADRTTSEALVRHPNVDKISFTGSSRAGRRVAALCGERLTRVTLELGGKSAAIVLPDADLDVVVPALVPTTILNNGQVCYNQTRVLVDQDRYGEVVDALTAAYAGMQVGDPFDEQTDVGPLISAVQRDRVEEYIRIGRQEGARITTGGSRPAGLERGYYVQPTVFDHVDNGMRIAQEEIFGPVVAVIPYRDEQDAVRIANDSVYGLSGSVWTSDDEHGRAVARRIRTGSVGVNHVWPDPLGTYGGFKQSGFGREGGPESVDSYVEVQTVQTGRR